MAHRSYAVLQNPRNQATRISWSPASGGAMYCGICLRGMVRTEIGHVCPSCESRVQQVFEVVNGGKPQQKLGAPQVSAAGWSMAETYTGTGSL